MIGLNVLERAFRKIASICSGHTALFSLSPRVDGVRKIICYSKNSWSLNFVWFGVASSRALNVALGGPEVAICDSIEELKGLFSSSNAYVFVMSGGRVGDVLRAGIPPQRIVYYAFHVKVNKVVPRLKEIRAILTQSLFEYNLMMCKGIDPSRVHRFPAGVNRSMFYPPAFIADSDCKIDVLFVGNSYSRQPCERFRKGCALQLDLVRRLADCGLRVAVVGPGWNDERELMSSQVQVLDPPYSEYPGLMRSSRLLCSVAVQEGGPLSFPEALACGCSTLSLMTGFPLEFSPGSEGVWHMRMGASADEWLMKIQAILSVERPSSWPSNGVREAFLRSSDYEQLGRQLVSVCFPELGEDSPG